MKQDPDRLFYSKILLFGEYSLIVGSMALSIPFHHYSGRFIRKPDWQIAEGGKQSNFQLDKFATYLEKMLRERKGNYSLDLEKFREEISKGLIFQSNIPQEYGLGSSGALVAAVYSAYGKPEMTDFSEQYKLSGFRDFLARMESFFHGKSSGLDPLISFLNKPLQINESGKVAIANLPDWQEEEAGALFLVDSGRSGETQPLVDRFMENCKNENFMREIQSIYIPVVNACINAYRNNNIDNLHTNIILLSEYQLKNFNPMIPPSIKQIWQEGLKSGKFTLKLCGSGGGGMVLGLTKDFDSVRKELKNRNLTLVHSI